MLQKASGTQAPSKSIASFRQAEFHALARGWGIAHKYGASSITMHGAVLDAVIDGRAILQADYGPLYKSDLAVAFKVDSRVLKGLKRIGGAGDVTINQGSGSGIYAFQGDHTEQPVTLENASPGSPLVIPPVTLIGEQVTNYSVKTLKHFVGKDAGKVCLAVYGDQLEQLAVPGGGTYTFTAGMLGKLAGRCPDAVFMSRVAFRYFGDNQVLQLGKIGDSYVLKVATEVDMGVTMVVWEQLDVVR